MTTRRRLILVGSTLAVFLVVVVVLRTRRPSESRPLAILFLGYTNGLGVSVISNQCSRTLWIWGEAYVEIAPFKATNRWTDWLLVLPPWMEPIHHFDHDVIVGSVSLDGFPHQLWRKSAARGRGYGTLALQRHFAFPERGLQAAST
jgi:hypothetical protein